MINFLIVLFVVLVKQILFMTSFCLAIYINSDGSDFIPIILLVLYLISHFKHTNKICDKLKLDNKLYNIYGFISWILVGVILLSILFDTWIWGLLPKTGGMFSGLEYILAPILLGIYLLVLGVIKLIVFIVKKIRKKN